MTVPAFGPELAPVPARHRQAARTPAGRLALRNLLRGRPQYTLLLLSDYGRAILEHKYDAFTTDLAYVKRPSGKLGPIGAFIDRVVLGVDLHADLRDRLGIVTDELVRAVTERREAGVGPVRVLSAPSGLCRDLIQAATALRGQDPAALQDVEWHALDLDERGDVLPEAERRCRAAGLHVRVHRADLFDTAAVRAALADRPVDVVNCVGLTPWLTLGEVERLVGFFARELIVPGGLLIIDTFARHSTSAAGDHLEIPTQYHAPHVLENRFARHGLGVVRRQTTARRVNTVYTVRRGPGTPG
jgi:hypothetical protein